MIPPITQLDATTELVIRSALATKVGWFRQDTDREIFLTLGNAILAGTEQPERLVELLQNQPLPSLQNEGKKLAAVIAADDEMAQTDAYDTSYDDAAEEDSSAVPAGLSDDGSYLVLF